MYMVDILNPEAQNKEFYLSNLDRLTKLINFSTYPIHSIHESWLDQFPYKDQFITLKHHKQNFTFLVEWIAQKFALQKLDYDFSDPMKRIGLLDFELIQALCLFSGCVLNNEYIKSIVLKQKIVDLKKIIGEQKYLFIVKKSAFLFSSKLANHIVLSRTYDKNDMNQFINKAIIDGFVLLISAFKTLSDYDRFLKYFILKVPKVWFDLSKQYPLAQLDNEASKRLILKICKEMSRK